MTSTRKQETEKSDKGTALITGASRGIGAVYAARLAKRGCDLVLVARSEARLRALSAGLTSETGRSVAPLAADLNDKADLAKVERRLRDDQTITMLVNNAGIGSVAPLLKADVEMMESCCRLPASLRCRPALIHNSSRCSPSIRRRLRCCSANTLI